MNILSIDYDYFFENIIGFDWGHNENSDMPIMEMIWNIRYFNRNLFNGKFAKDIKPDIGDFWDVLTPYCDQIDMLVISESHADIQHFISEGDIVYNFDQHHDTGYSDKKPVLIYDCENWAVDKRIAEYHLIYPPWRKESLENAFKRNPDTISFKITSLPKFGRIFVCRSGAWTPTWCDNYWIDFIARAKTLTSRVVINDDADKKRRFDLTTARKFALKFD